MKIIQDICFLSCIIFHEAFSYLLGGLFPWYSFITDPREITAAEDIENINSRMKPRVDTGGIQEHFDPELCKFYNYMMLKKPIEVHLVGLVGFPYSLSLVF